MYDEYDKWNQIKKRIALSNHKPPYYKEKDIWWVSIGYNIGYEVYGKGKSFVRPVLVIKKFSREIFLGVPLSSVRKRNPYYVPITIKEKKASALISQIRVFSTKRVSNKLGELDSKDYEKVLEKVLEIIYLSPPVTRGSCG